MNEDKCACGARLVNGGCSNQILDLTKYIKNYTIPLINPYTELSKKLDEANKRIEFLETELAKKNSDSYSSDVGGSEIPKPKFKACAEVSFMPKTS